MSKKIAEQYAARVWDDQDLEAITELMDPNVVIHSPLGDYQGPRAMKEVVETWQRAFPDLQVENQHSITEGEITTLHWRASGTHKAPFKGKEAMGAKISYAGVTIYRVQDQKITEYWAYVELDHLLSQI